MDKTTKKINGKCVLSFFGGITIFAVLLFAVFFLKINSREFPEGLFISVIVIAAAIMIIFGCHEYKLVPKNKRKDGET